MSLPWELVIWFAALVVVLVVDFISGMEDDLDGY